MSRKRINKRKTKKNELLTNNDRDDYNIQSDSQRKRAERKKLQRRKKFIRRRIILGLIFFALIVLGGKFISNAINSYKVMGYPDFRDEVLESLGREVFVSPSENRSLSAGEKITDFESLYNIIQRSYAVDNENKENYKKFLGQYNDFRKKIALSKTDQEYFTLINQYLAILDDSRTFILEKDTYQNLFDYYKDKKNSNKKSVLEDPQAVDRYKRLITDANVKKEATKGEIITNGLMVIRMEDFRPKEFENDLKNITDTFLANPPVGKLIIDLSNNNSIDHVYWNKFARILIPEDYKESNIIFYRSKLFEDSLKTFKEDENNPYDTALAKNDASKYKETKKLINPSDYLYYDQLDLSITKNTDYSTRKIYVLTNSNTANEAIKFADFLKKNGAYLVKNALDSKETKNDIVYNAPTDLYLLEHSGLILSINSSFCKNDENIYLSYDQKINSKDPISSMLSIVNQ